MADCIMRPENLNVGDASSVPQPAAISDIQRSVGGAEKKTFLDSVAAGKWRILLK